MLFWFGERLNIFAVINVFAFLGWLFCLLRTDFFSKNLMSKDFFSDYYKNWNYLLHFIVSNCGWADLFGSICSGRKTITGSFVGSIKEIEEMLDFCKEKGLTSMIEIIKMDYVNKAIERLEKNDVRYRFVVDVAGSKLDQWKQNTLESD